MNQTDQALRAVLGLSRLATEGTMEYTGESHRISAVAHMAMCDTFAVYPRAEPQQLAAPETDARFIAATVNLVRQHGPALLRAVEDARRFDWIMSAWAKTLTPQLEAVIEAFRTGEPDQIRAAIDAAIAEGEG